ncbi:pantothenate kinase [Rhodothalassium salexigens]|uniref:type III pantothenate kinase n=1 Tax=Rhodothalassium salexigens TaxID=1086 RepID=UPI0019126673|nr:type III pantothenate kinase [Rhodothalassium salexigens]MBK5911669.1 pantothenate kinase [Rhodothalassium salexigens]MBK5920962.1 pantothenate kinase [Rhodothalassium salexigens]
MLLTIDAGNTNTVFALLDGKTIVRQWRISTVVQRTSDEYMVWISQLMRLADLDPADVNGAILATVVPPVQRHLVRLCADYFQCDPLIVGDERVDLGVGVRVPNPGEVGADRLVNAVAGHQLYGGPLIVVDFGTATTFDVIGETGDYLGGVIAPGINLSLWALHEAAAKLPRIAVEEPSTSRVTGTTTLDAMQSGIYWGYVGLLEGIVDRLRQEHDPQMRVLGTGGLARVFFNRTDAIDAVDGDLTLHGLRLIYERNVTAPAVS